MNPNKDFLENIVHFMQEKHPTFSLRDLESNASILYTLIASQANFYGISEEEMWEQYRLRNSG